MTLYVPRVCSVYDMMINEYWAVTETRNPNIHSKPAPVTFYPPEFPHDLIWDRNRAAAVRSRLLTPVLLYPYVYMYVLWIYIHTDTRDRRRTVGLEHVGITAEVIVLYLS
jgi:hypothetical protein